MKTYSPLDQDRHRLRVIEHRHPNHGTTYEVLDCVLCMRMLREHMVRLDKYDAQIREWSKSAWVDLPRETFYRDQMGAGR